MRTFIATMDDRSGLPDMIKRAKRERLETDKKDKIAEKSEELAKALADKATAATPRRKKKKKKPSLSKLLEPYIDEMNGLFSGGKYEFVLGEPASVTKVIDVDGETSYRREPFIGDEVFVCNDARVGRSGDIIFNFDVIGLPVDDRGNGLTFELSAQKARQLLTGFDDFLDEVLKGSSVKEALLVASKETSDKEIEEYVKAKADVYGEEFGSW